MRKVFQGGLMLSVAAAAALMLSGCATTEEVEHAQATADTALSTAQQAQAAAGNAHAAAASAQTTADQARADAAANSAKIAMGQRG